MLLIMALALRVTIVNDASSTCDLCQLPILGQGYFLQTTLGLKRFCCEGCQGIYRMLHESEIPEDSAKGD
jgi:hypothetical protein